MDEMLDTIQVEVDGLESAGFLFPVEFIGTLADKAADTLAKWMEQNGAPVEAVRVVDQILYFARAEHDIEAGTLRAGTAETLLEMVAEMTDSIVKLGGDFEGGGSIARREPVRWGVKPASE